MTTFLIILNILFHRRDLSHNYLSGDVPNSLNPLFCVLYTNSLPFDHNCFTCNGSEVIHPSPKCKAGGMHECPCLEAPTLSPTIQPTSTPTSPTVSPTEEPTLGPTIQPTFAPTYPTFFPTKEPSAAPTLAPTNMSQFKMESPTDNDVVLIGILVFVVVVFLCLFFVGVFVKQKNRKGKRNQSVSSLRPQSPRITSSPRNARHSRRSKRSSKSIGTIYYVNLLYFCNFHLLCSSNYITDRNRFIKVENDGTLWYCELENHSKRIRRCVISIE